MNKSTFRSTAAAFLLAVILALGIQAIWAFACVWAQQVISQIFRGSPIQKQLVITRDGRALIQEYNSDVYPGQTFRTLDGQPVDGSVVDDLQQGWYQQVLPGPADDRRWDERWLFRVTGFLQASGQPTYWYLIHDGHSPGHAYFEGFDPMTKRSIGYLGLRGFRDVVPPLAEQFAVDRRVLTNGGAVMRGAMTAQGREPAYALDSSGPSIMHIVSGNSLVAIDLRKHTVTPVDLLEKVISVGLVADPHASTTHASAHSKQRIAVRSPKSIVLLDADDRPQRTIAMPAELADTPIIVYETTGQDVVLWSQQPLAWHEVKLYWIAADGTVARNEIVTLYPKPSTQVSWAQSLFVALIAPVPILLVLFTFVFIPWAQVSNGMSPNLAAALSESLKAGGPALILALALSIWLGVVCLRHARRNGIAAPMLWATFVLFCGLPGYIGYRLHRRWPAQERCAQCGAIVPRDRQECLACSAEFPAPKLTGVEVFA